MKEGMHMPKEKMSENKGKLLKSEIFSVIIFACIFAAIKFSLLLIVIGIIIGALVGLLLWSIFFREEEDEDTYRPKNLPATDESSKSSKELPHSVLETSSAAALGVPKSGSKSEKEASRPEDKTKALKDHLGLKSDGTIENKTSDSGKSAETDSNSFNPGAAGASADADNAFKETPTSSSDGTNVFAGFDSSNTGGSQKFGE
jgi:hypothetical protein